MVEDYISTFSDLCLYLNDHAHLTHHLYLLIVPPYLHQGQGEGRRSQCRRGLLVFVTTRRPAALGLLGLHGATVIFKILPVSVERSTAERNNAWPFCPLLFILII